MGKGNSKLKPEELKDLRENTAFSDAELQVWYKSFSKNYPTGCVTIEEFKTIYQDFFPFRDASKFAEHIFRNFDKDGNGTIDFREFICGLSTTSRGTVEQKLAFTFNVYDVDGSGYISRSELLDVMKGLFKLVENIENIVERPEDESTPEKLTDKIFRLRDKNQDGQLSFAEFVEGAKDDPSILRLLQI